MDRRLAYALLPLTLSCGLVLNIDNYRGCDGGECGEASAGDASMEGGDAGCSVAACKAQDPLSVMCTAAGTCGKVTSIARGSSLHECVLLADGSVVCWGQNNSGELGRVGTSPYSNAPRVVPSIPRMSSVGVGIGFTCALTSSGGQVYCWGQQTAGGNSLTPVIVSLPPSHPAQSLSVGQSDACAVLDDHEIFCWGDNLWGESGCTSDAGLCAAHNGTVAPPTIPTTKPLQISTGVEQYDRVAVGIFQTCAIIGKTGQVHCWGVSDHLGIDVSTQYICCSQSDLSPPSGGPAKGLFSTEFYACRQDDVGDTDCWGENISCAFGDANCNANLPAQLAPIVDPSAGGKTDYGATLAPGWHHMCWRTTTGKVYCRGEAQYAALGTGTPGGVYAIGTNQLAPVKGLTADVSGIEANRFFTCVLQTDGDVKCWGGFGEWLTGTSSVASTDGGPNIVLQATSVDWGTP